MKHCRELIRKAQAGDKAARDQLVEDNEGLVRSVVNRFTSRGIDKEDLYQIGMIGLIKAIDYFDLNYDVKFSTYAVPRISGEIRRFLRDDGIIRVSRSIKDQRVMINRARITLIDKMGREPKLSELAEETGLDIEDVMAAINSGQDVESLYQTVYEGEGNNIALLDKLAIKGCEGDELLDKIILSDTLSALEKNERKLIVLRFYLDQTQSQVAGRLGVSQVQVSRLERRILKKMKTLIGQG